MPLLVALLFLYPAYTARKKPTTRAHVLFLKNVLTLVEHLIWFTKTNIDHITSNPCSTSTKRQMNSMSHEASRSHSRALLLRPLRPAASCLAQPRAEQTDEQLRGRENVRSVRTESLRSPLPLHTTYRRHFFDAAPGRLAGRQTEQTRTLCPQAAAECWTGGPLSVW